MDAIVLALFLVDNLLHCAGYGRLYMRQAQTVFEVLLVLGNATMLVALVRSSIKRKNLYGVKLLLSVSLLYLRLDKLRAKLTLLCAKQYKGSADSERNMNALLESTMNKVHMGVVSVREKVIEELRSVQERVDHDARADVALEYCIKMIANNQLNEQDFDFDDNNDEEVLSEDDSQSVASDRHGQTGHPARAATV